MPIFRRMKDFSMKIAPFQVEEFFAVYEFTTIHILCASDCESTSVAELLQMAGLSLADLGRTRLGYTESQGHPDLRAAISETYSDVQPDQVVVLSSPEEGIYLTMRTLLEPGDHVIVLTPAYNSLLNLAKHIGGEVSEWRLIPGQTGWCLDLNELETLVNSRTRLLVVNFPQNPTGFLPSLDEFISIIDFAKEHDLWLFCDEMYRGLERVEASRLPSAADLYTRCITLSGLSKVHGLPGLRSGWLVIRDASVRDDLINWKYYTSICAPAPSEFLALTTLQIQDKLIRRNRSLIEENISVATSFFNRWERQFTWRPPQAGSVALVGLNQPSATNYCHKLAKEAGVLLLPSSCLGYGDEHVRFGFGRADFTDCLDCLERYLEKNSFSTHQ